MRGIAKTLGLMFAGAFAALMVSSAMQIHSALAASTTAYTVPTGATTLETIACNSGTSPCAVTTSAAILNPNPSRMQCLLQNVDVGDYQCVQGATVAGAGTASTTNMHFVLKAASAANKGDGGTFSCSQGPAIYRGAVVCTCSGTCHLNASAASAAGF